MFTKFFGGIVNRIIVNKIKDALRGLEVNVDKVKIVVPVVVTELPKGISFGQLQDSINKLIDGNIENKFRNALNIEIEIKRGDGIQ